jgi:CoA-transferase family III
VDHGPDDHESCRHEPDDREPDDREPGTDRYWVRCLFGTDFGSGVSGVGAKDGQKADANGPAAVVFGALTGWPDRPRAVPSLFMRRVTRLAELVSHLSGHEVSGFDLLVERSRFQPNLVRRGTTSCGGSTRLLPTADGTVALALTRPSDIGSLPALLESDIPGTDADTADEALWNAVRAEIAGRRSAHWIGRATLLGLALSGLGETRAPTPSSPAVRRTAFPRVEAPVHRAPRVVDLSSLWAGPLCSRILTSIGADVVKVEDVNRPDGARLGSSEFFRRLHAGQTMVQLDLSSPRGRDELCALIDRADVVIEASRPRGLRGLGIDAEHILRTTGVRTWVSITGHGRSGVGADRVAFGDDAAVAGGLVAGGPVASRASRASGASGEVCFLGDAVADPLTGLVAACAVIDSLQSQRTHHTAAGCLLDVAMARVSAAFSDHSDDTGVYETPTG